MRLLAAITCVVVASGAAVAAASPAAASPTVTSVRSGHDLRPGQRLTSADGRFRATVEAAGRFVVRTASGRVVWGTPPTSRGATLTLARSGQLSVHHGAERWFARTAGAGSSTVLRLRNDGVPILTAGPLTVWTARARNTCPKRSGRTFVVDLSEQLARMCVGGQQVRVTPVTTGASAKGNGTPRGTWRVQRKIRNTTLYPAAGGAYPVKYWVPYDGAYGIHDSSWQRFAYGSAKYKTLGSHGCTHVPATAMAWFYRWVRVGTTVTVRR